MEAVELFPAWSGSSVAYQAHARVRYLGRLYRVIQSHISQPDWCPKSTPALFTELVAPGEIPVWRQPSGAEDAYGIGARVRYPDADGLVWISTVGSNVWEPGVYGWETRD